MTSSALKLGFVILPIVILLAYIYNDHTTPTHNLHLILEGLLKTESSATVNPEARIAVGFGGCLDALVNGLDVLETLGASTPDVPENFNELHSLKELEKTFAYFFMHGASAGYVALCSLDVLFICCTIYLLFASELFCLKQILILKQWCCGLTQK